MPPSSTSPRSTPTLVISRPDSLHFDPLMAQTHTLGSDEEEDEEEEEEKDLVTSAIERANLISVGRDKGKGKGKGKAKEFDRDSLDSTGGEEGDEDSPSSSSPRLNKHKPIDRSEVYRTEDYGELDDDELPTRGDGRVKSEEARGLLEDEEKDDSRGKNRDRDSLALTRRSTSLELQTLGGGGGGGSDGDGALAEAGDGSGFGYGYGRLRWGLDRAFLKEMVTQTVPVLLFSVMGLVASGELLNRMAEWRVFIRVEELFILVPILQNLKGNLEMNLAARFSTSANLGELDIRNTRKSLIIGNLALLQVQALLVSFLSGLVAFILGILSRKGVHHGLQNPTFKPGGSGDVDIPLNGTLSDGIEDGGNDSSGGTLIKESLRGGYFECLMVLCASMLAASLSSGILGSFMTSLVVLCRKFGIDPDNIATPLAASLGDLVTLTILGMVSATFAHFMGTLVSTFVFIILLCCVAFNVVVTWRNAYVQELLSSGWTPLLAAMVISSGTGLVLERFVNEFEGYALLAPVVTGLSGNIGAIFTSRISTSLHITSSSSSSSSNIIAASRRPPLFPLALPIVLILICLIILFLFLLFALLTHQVIVSSTIIFVILYSMVIVLTTVFSLMLGGALCKFLWRKGYDPDVYALPLLSSLVDVFGQCLLVIAYSITRAIAGRAEIPSDETIPSSSSSSSPQSRAFEYWSNQNLSFS